ncbi:hypothetical protein [Xanthomonas pisi]|uniref:hypothetical protein n=1 Tax=Xanthomonas pisi TaxID=56457 RepID=UPI000A43CAD8|nr:hypothetical protein [Xanthomonas pisi]
MTDAAGGICREIIKAMAAVGATVVATDLREGVEIEGAAEHVKHDVTSKPIGTPLKH